MKKVLSHLNFNAILYLLVGGTILSLTSLHTAQNQRVNYLYGMFTIDKNDCRNAIRFFGYVVHLAPNDHAAWRSIGFCQFQLEEFNAATDSYRKALTLDPQNSLYNQEFSQINQIINELKTKEIGE